MKLNKEARAALDRQRELFIQKFGREPNAGDPVFFDPDENEPRPIDPDALNDAIMTALIGTGIRPELVYAYRKTGRIVGETGYKSMSASARKEWNAAIDEYFFARDRVSFGTGLTKRRPPR